MQPVVTDGNEGIGCPAQELYSLALQHCEGDQSRGRETLSPEVSDRLILLYSLCSVESPLEKLWKLWTKAGEESTLHSESTRQQL